MSACGPLIDFDFATSCRCILRLLGRASCEALLLGWLLRFPGVFLLKWLLRLFGLILWRFRLCLRLRLNCSCRCCCLRSKEAHCCCYVRAACCSWRCCRLCAAFRSCRVIFSRYHFSAAAVPWQSPVGDVRPTLPAASAVVASLSLLLQADVVSRRPRLDATAEPMQPLAAFVCRLLLVDDVAR